MGLNELESTLLVIIFRILGHDDHFVLFLPHLVVNRLYNQVWKELYPGILKSAIHTAGYTAFQAAFPFVDPQKLMWFIRNSPEVTPWDQTVCLKKYQDFIHREIKGTNTIESKQGAIQCAFVDLMKVFWTMKSLTLEDYMHKIYIFYSMYCDLEFMWNNFKLLVCNSDELHMYEKCCVKVGEMIPLPFSFVEQTLYALQCVGKFLMSTQLTHTAASELFAYMWNIADALMRLFHYYKDNVCACVLTGLVMHTQKELTNKTLRGQMLELRVLLEHSQIITLLNVVVVELQHHIISKMTTIFWTRSSTEDVEPIQKYLLECIAAVYRVRDFGIVEQRCKAVSEFVKQYNILCLKILEGKPPSFQIPWELWLPGPILTEAIETVIEVFNPLHSFTLEEVYTTGSNITCEVQGLVQYVKFDLPEFVVDTQTKAKVLCDLWTGLQCPDGYADLHQQVLSRLDQIVGKLQTIQMDPAPAAKTRRLS